MNSSFIEQLSYHSTYFLNNNLKPEISLLTNLIKFLIFRNQLFSKINKVLIKNSLPYILLQLLIDSTYIQKLFYYLDNKYF